MAFPTSPSNGQVATLNGISYTYNSTTNSWTRRTAASAVLSLVTDTFTATANLYYTNPVTGVSSYIVPSSYTLSTTPLTSDFVSINIDGVLQQKSAYILNGNIITFTSVPYSGSVIECRSTISTNMGVLTGLNYDSFTGDGSTVNFTLTATPTNKNYTLVDIAGVVQNKTSYSVSGTTLTFNSAPASSVAIECITFGPAISTSVPYGSNTQIQYNNAGTIGANANLTFTSSTSTFATINETISGNSSISNLAVGNAFTLGSWTTSGRPTPANGMMGYNTTNNKIEAYANGAWINITT